MNRLLELVLMPYSIAVVSVATIRQEMILAKLKPNTPEKTVRKLYRQYLAAGGDSDTFIVVTEDIVR